MSGIDTEYLQTVPDYMVEAGILDAPIDVAEHVVSELTSPRPTPHPHLPRDVRAGRSRPHVRWVRGAVGAGVLFVVLEIVTRAGLVTESYLPPASSILAETFRLLSRTASSSATSGPR